MTIYNKKSKSQNNRRPINNSLDAEDWKSTVNVNQTAASTAQIGSGPFKELLSCFTVFSFPHLFAFEFFLNKVVHPYYFFGLRMIKRERYR